MSSRSTELRNRERHVFRASFGIAVALHVAALGFVVWSRADPEWSPGRETIRLEDGSWTGTRIDVFFGPPKIYESSGRSLSTRMRHLVLDN